MMRSLGQAWSRDAVGFRQGELDDGDGVATMVVTLIGGPALIVGALLVTDDGLSVGQILLIAPVAALVGAALVGVSAAMAAQTGANSSWLLRPSFGRAGSLVVSVARLAMVAAWAVIGLQIAGDWTDSLLTDAGMSPAPQMGIGVVAVLGLVLVVLGLVTTIRIVIRKPLFILSVLLVAFVAWRVAAAGVPFAAGGDGSFWVGVQRAVEMAVIFIPFVQTVARRLHNDEDALTSFGVGYAIPATVMLIAGAIIAMRLGEFPFDLLGLEVGTTAVALAVAWVLVAEVDQAFSGFVAAGSESVGLLRLGPTWVIGFLVVGLVVVGAIMMPDLPIEWAALLTAVVFPAALISAADFYFARDHHYTEADIYGRGDTEGFLNVMGMTCWILAVILGHILDPVGPAEWTSLIPRLELDMDLPWRLIMALLLAAFYVVFQIWQGRRAASVYELRGI